MPYLFTIESLEDEPTKVRPPPPMPAARPMALDTQLAVVASPRLDLEGLTAILSKPERLTTAESRAFSGMRDKMRARLLYALSYAQRSWAQEVAARLGFDVESPTGWRETHDEIRRNAPKR